MCNVIILLNKPLEEDIPFTTSSEAGAFKHFFCLLVFSEDVKTCTWLNLGWMIFFLSILDFFYFRVRCNLSFVISKTSRLRRQRQTPFCQKCPQIHHENKQPACFENSKFTSAALFFVCVCFFLQNNRLKEEKKKTSQQKGEQPTKFQYRIALVTTTH